MEDYERQQAMYYKELYGKVQYCEELRGIHGFRGCQHYKQALLIECRLCQLKRAMCQ